jgi:ribonucleoside-diphosphate reductase alpha chain
MTVKKHTYQELNAQVNLFDSEGKLQVHKDKEAVRAYFLQHVNRKMQWFHDGLEEKLDYLFGSNDDNYVYYDRAVFDQYTPAFIKSLYKEIYAYHYRFTSYMGAKTFYDKYALKTIDKEMYLERFEDRVAAAALELGAGDTKLARNIAEELITGRLLASTPTFANAAKKQGGMKVSCRLLQVEDNLNSIMRAATNGAKLAQAGAGVAFDLTSVRAEDDPIRGISGLSNGIVPWCRILETVFASVDQLGTRPGSAAVYASIFHADILNLLKAKSISANADKKTGLNELSVGITIPDIFFELVKNNEDACLFSPYDVAEKYGVPFSDVDITEKYREMEYDPDIRKKRISARELAFRVAEVQAESGYPYLMFIDQVNRENPVPGRIKYSNLCTEILQVSTPSEIDDLQVYQHIGRDISCNLASLNLNNLVNTPNFERSIDTAMRALTTVSLQDKANIPPLDRGNSLSHSVGLGMMGLHTTLAGIIGVDYDSDEARDFASTIAMMINYYSIKSSSRIAKERGKSFYGFQESGYYTGEYFQRYFENDYSPKSTKIRKFFAERGLDVPTQEDWKKLAALVKKQGMFHGWRLAHAPTGTLSYCSHASPSSAPVPGAVEKRTDSKGTTYVPAFGLTDENAHLYRRTYDIGWRAMIDMIATIQPHVDQGISMTLFYPEDATSSDMVLAMIHAQKKGIKTIYYTRILDPDATEEEDLGCVSCAL